MKILWLAVFLAGCGQTAPSDVQWCKLAGNRQSVLSAKTLLICGGTYELRLDVLEAYRAIVSHVPWREAKVWWGGDCTGRFDGVLDVGLAACPQGTVGWHSQTANYHAIRVCSGYRKDSYRIMLHEVMHAIGAGDQYRAGNASRVEHHSNCGYPRSWAAGISIMNGFSVNGRGVLTQDDIAGIKAIERTLE